MKKKVSLFALSCIIITISIMFGYSTVFAAPVVCNGCGQTVEYCIRPALSAEATHHYYGCPVCGYTTHVSTEWGLHQWAVAYDYSTTTEHTLYCPLCYGNGFTNTYKTEGHVDSNGDGVCDVCSTQMHVHEYSYVDREDGTHQSVCTGCGAFGADPQAHYDNDGDGYCDACNAQLACNHTIGTVEGDAWSEWGNNTATCTEGGQESRTCSKCQAVEYRDTDPLGHIFGDGYGFNENNHWKTCTRCGTSNLNLAQHRWDDGVQTTDPTCAATGVMTYTCIDCGFPRTESIPATGNHTWGDWTEDVAATCTEGGREKRECSNCDAVDYRDTDPLGHNFEVDYTYDDDNHWRKCTRCDEITDFEPHYDNDGDDECDVCGYDMSCNHVWGDWTEDVAATCTEGGREKRECSNCDAVDYRDTDPLEHNLDGVAWTTTDDEHWKECKRCHDEIDLGDHEWNNGVQTTAPTCIEKGVMTYTCNVCGKTKTEDIDEVDHDVTGVEYSYDEDNHWKECTECGEEVDVEPHVDNNQDGVCDICGYDSTCNHVWGDWTEDVVATCTEGGREKRECLNCDAVDYRDTNPLGHNLDGVAWTTTDDEHWKVCARCGSNVEVGVHDWDAGVETTAPTCTTAGVMTYTCTVCGKTKTDGINVIDHTPSEYQKDTEGHWKECTVCGDVIEDKEPHEDNNQDGLCDDCGYDMTCDHQWDDGEVTTEPTCTEPGVKTYTCTLCGTTIEEEVAPLGHEEGGYNYNSREHWKKCVRCGEEIPQSRGKHEFEGKICRICLYKKKSSSSSSTTTSTVSEEVLVEPWTQVNPKLKQIAVSLRQGSNNDDKANKNIYALREEVTYYVDYKNGSSSKMQSGKLVLELPLDVTFTQKDSGKVNGNTITWNFINGLKAGESGTKVVKLKYTSLGNKNLDSKTVYPKATIYSDEGMEDVSSVITLVYKDSSTTIGGKHEPYMYGDRDATTFRPDDGISRAEGALVLTRIFGIDTSNIAVTNVFSDLDETYLEAQQAIIAASQLDLINGYPDGTYKPNRKMTRAEFMKIIASNIELVAKQSRIEGLEVKSMKELIKAYKDPAENIIPNEDMNDRHWAVPYLTLLARLNMTSVSSKEEDLRSDVAITRAEVAQLVNYYLFRAPAEVTRNTSIGFSDVSKNHKLFADILEATRSTHEFVYTKDGKEEI